MGDRWGAAGVQGTPPGPFLGFLLLSPPLPPAPSATRPSAGPADPAGGRASERRRVPARRAARSGAEGTAHMDPEHRSELTPAQRREQLARLPPLRGDSGLVGLMNQGATCYLNSLLQALFMTPELRAGLFAVDPSSLGFDDLSEDGAGGDAGGAAAAKAAKAAEAAEADEAYVQQLGAMGFPAAACERACLAVSNRSMDAAMEWLLAHPEEVDRANSAAPAAAEKKKRRPRRIALELQRLFTQLQLSAMGAVPTEQLTSRGFRWETMDGRTQHDLHELQRLLLDALERQLSRSSGRGLVPSLFRGLSARQIECLHCGAVREREEPFYDLMLQVRGLGDVVSALHAYTAAETLSGANAYACEACGGRREAALRVVLRALPPVLTLSLARFDFDLATLRREKVTEKFAFPVTLDMSPFAEAQRSAADDPAAARARCSWLGDPPRGAAGDAAGDPYDLSAVIVHRGTAHSGHYHAFVRDVLGEGRWAAPALAAEAEALLREALAAAGGEAPLDALAEEVRTRAGGPWAKVYRSSLGGLEAFLRARPRLFAVDGARGTAALRGGAPGGAGPAGPAWFDFNDAEVRAVGAERLASAFEGRESAYILLYRRRGAAAPPAAPAPPAAWAAAVAEENRRFALRREELLRTANAMDLRVASPAMLRRSWPHLVPRRGAPPFGTLALDLRWPRARVAAAALAALPAADREALAAAVAAGEELRVSLLRPIHGRYFVAADLHGALRRDAPLLSLVADLRVCEADALLLWAGDARAAEASGGGGGARGGASAGGTPSGTPGGTPNGTPGDTPNGTPEGTPTPNPTPTPTPTPDPPPLIPGDTPLALRVTTLVPSAPPSACRASVSATSTAYITEACSLEDALSAVAAAASIAPAELCASLLVAEPSGAALRFRAEPLAPRRRRSAAECGLLEGAEVLAEARDARGLHASSLGEAEALRRGGLRAVLVVEGGGPDLLEGGAFLERLFEEKEEAGDVQLREIAMAVPSEGARRTEEGVVFVGAAGRRMAEVAAAVADAFGGGGGGSQGPGRPGGPGRGARERRGKDARALRGGGGGGGWGRGRQGGRRGARHHGAAREGWGWGWG